MHVPLDETMSELRERSDEAALEELRAREGYQMTKEEYHRFLWSDGDYEEYLKWEKGQSNECPCQH